MKDSVYCDHCGDMVEESASHPLNARQVMTHKPYTTFSGVPFNVASGESAVVCNECLDDYSDDHSDDHHREKPMIWKANGR